MMEWKLVPVEPTRYMLTEAHFELTDPANHVNNTVRAMAVFKAMLAAAPTPPAQEAEPVGYLWRNKDWTDWRFCSEMDYLHGVKNSSSHEYQFVYTRPDQSELVQFIRDKRHHLPIEDQYALSVMLAYLKSEKDAQEGK